MTECSLVICSGPMRSVPFMEFLDAAQQSGFHGISLGLDVYGSARDAQGFSDADLRAAITDHGLAVDYIDGLVHWLPNAPAVATLGSGSLRFAYKHVNYFAVAEALGADLVNVLEIYNSSFDVNVAAEALAAVADEAAEHGCRICLEFTPLGGIPDARTAWDIVRAADRSNVGVLLDTWHYGRGSSTPEQLLAIPADRYFALQISDTKPIPDPTWSMKRSTIGSSPGPARRPSPRSFYCWMTMGYDCLSALRSSPTNSLLSVLSRPAGWSPERCKT